ncbi:COP9 signalosome complex subunit 7a [Galendromus occidentalis]|uniref:COP9 signalosome complex subunit 7a n=1 Tax=Galendromus occidentalis TaxID=34638 RepID=A0AAJ6QMB4_9ACAR|nr:COP9 signalosome complex subunit 7a [Galendromus occidentalis]
MQSAQSLEKMDTRSVQNILQNSGPLEAHVNRAREATTAREIKDIIENAVESPQVLVFGELLDLPSVKQLRETEYADHFRLLELFAYGTFRDYQRDQNPYPQLSEAMIKKLRYLTVASLASRSRSLRYSELLTELGLSTRRELEDLIIEAMYARIVTGKLDQRSASLEVDRALARDVSEDLSAVSRVLENWSASCEATLEAIEKECERSSRLKNQYQERLNALETRVLSLRAANNDESEEQPASKHKVRVKM